jgi:hypothetical protein
MVFKIAQLTDMYMCAIIVATIVAIVQEDVDNENKRYSSSYPY